MNEDRFVDLLDQARRGDVAALTMLVMAMEPELRAVVRLHLPRLLRAKYDSNDFVQSVLASVWSGLNCGGNAPLDGFESARQFRAYLAAVAKNKVIAEFRRRTRTRKYNVKREEPLYVKRHGRDELRTIAAHDPSPSQNAQAEDRINQLVAGRSPIESEMIRLRRQGLTFEEIAGRLGVHERSIRRVIDSLRLSCDEEFSR